jgi:hypothetical protein
MIFHLSTVLLVMEMLNNKNTHTFTHAPSKAAVRQTGKDSNAGDT